MKQFINILFIILISNFSLNGQCDIADYDIFYCDSANSIDLTISAPNPNGTYEYFEFGNLVAAPTNYITFGNVLLNVVFTENATGCTSEFVISVIWKTVPEITSPDTPVLDCIITQVQLLIDVEPIGDYEFNWSGPGQESAISDPAVQNPFVDAPGIYFVEVVDITSNCADTDSILVISNVDFPFVEIEVIQNLDGTATLVATSLIANSTYLYNWQGNGIISSPDEATILVSSVGIYAVVVTDPINSWTTTKSVEVDSIDIQTNIFDALQMDEVFTVYPNPISNLINVKTDFTTYNLYLLDSNGRKTIVELNSLNQIDTSNLPDGIYFLGLEKNSLIYWRKIMKNSQR